jgi:hypothetical protein
MLLSGLMAFVSLAFASFREPGAPVFVGGPPAVVAEVAMAPVEIVLPEELVVIPEKPAAVDPAPGPDKQDAEPNPAQEPEKCVKCGADRETFGTSVAFVRNPREASRLAREEHKLTFLLHVSGNFEDSRFT